VQGVVILDEAGDMPAARGSGLAIPSWLTFVKQPVPQVGSPQLDR